MKKETFDNIIKQNLVNKHGSHLFGYQIANRIYENYYTDSAFQDFKKEMKKPEYIKYYDSYDAGKGSELKRQKGRYGEVPPKMASVASSSRFCYLALRDDVGALGGSGTVEFEKGQAIRGISGIAPQLDAYIPQENIFVEAKCHEIFDAHKVILKKQYWDLFYGRDNDFEFPEMEKNDVSEFEIPLSVFDIKGKENTRFDIKQLLCHLLGIVSQKEKDASATLVYLFFKPIAESASENKQIETVFKELKEEIKCIFNSDPIQNFIRNNHMTLRAVAECAKVMEPLKKDNLDNLF